MSLNSLQIWRKDNETEVLNSPWHGRVCIPASHLHIGRFWRSSRWPKRLVGAGARIHQSCQRDRASRGYFAFVEGVPGPFFSGNPSEATAFFTFRSDTLTLTPPIANGPDVSAIMFSPGTFTVYLNASPNGNFASLDSFSSGKPVATFLRSAGMISNVAGSTGTATFSAKLVSSQDFLLQGRNVNFANLVPNGVTVLITTSPNFVAGTSDFPVAQPFTFSAIALGSESGYNSQ